MITETNKGSNSSRSYPLNQFKTELIRNGKYDRQTKSRLMNLNPVPFSLKRIEAMVHLLTKRTLRDHHLKTLELFKVISETKFAPTGNLR